MASLRTAGPAGRRVLLSLRLGDALYALPVEAVAEVLPALPVEPVPGCPEFIRGVIFVRGHLIPVLDAAERLGLKGHRRAPDPHIVCLRTKDRYIGLEVDEALDLMDVTGRTPLPAGEVGAREGFLAGLLELDGKVIRVLDPERIVARDEAARLAALPGTASAPAAGSA